MDEKSTLTETGVTSGPIAVDPLVLVTLFKRATAVTKKHRAGDTSEDGGTTYVSADPSVEGDTARLRVSKMEEPDEIKIKSNYLRSYRKCP